jgi:hypothetical protein
LFTHSLSPEEVDFVSSLHLTDRSNKELTRVDGKKIRNVKTQKYELAGSLKLAHSSFA